MGCVRMGPPTDIVRALKDYGNIEYFIETGSYKGNTALWASTVFGEVFSLEQSTILYSNLPSGNNLPGNVRFIKGDSKSELKKLVSKLQTNALFWLDAHWSGGDTHGFSEECPVIEEIRIINEDSNSHCILIDDARLFCMPPPEPHNWKHWPAIDTVLEAVQSDSHKYYVSIVDDVIIAVPEAWRTNMVNILRNRKMKISNKKSVASRIGLKLRRFLGPEKK